MTGLLIFTSQVIHGYFRGVAIVTGGGHLGFWSMQIYHGNSKALWTVKEAKSRPFFIEDQYLREVSVRYEYRRVVFCLRFVEINGSLCRGKISQRK